MISEMARHNRLVVGKGLDLFAAICLIVALFLPIGQQMLAPVYIFYKLPSLMAVLLGILFLFLNAAMARPRIMWGILLVALGAFLFLLAHNTLIAGIVYQGNAPGFWLVVLSASVAIWRGLQLLTWPGGYLLPYRQALSGVIFAVWLYCLWYVLAEGLGWARQVFPSPADLTRIWDYFEVILQRDLRQSFFITLMHGWSYGVCLGFLIGTLSALLWRNKQVVEASAGTYDWIGWVFIAPVLIVAMGTIDYVGAVLTIFIVTMFPVGQAVMRAWHVKRSQALADYYRSLGQSASKSYVVEMFFLHVIPALLKAMARSLVVAALAVVFAEFFLRQDYGVGVRIYGESYLMNTDFAFMSLLLYMLAVGILRGLLTHMLGIYKEIVFGEKRL